MRRRIFFAVILAVLGTIGLGIFPAYAGTFSTYADASRSATDVRTATPQKSTLTVTITSVGNPTIREGEKLHVEVRVSNKGDSPLTLAVQLYAHRKSFATRSHLLAFIGESTAAKDSSDQLVSVTKSPKPLALAAHSEQTLVLEAETTTLTEMGWNAQDWGPRGIEVRVSSSSKEVVSDRSFVIVEPSNDIKPVPTGVAVPLTDSRSELSALYTIDNLAQIRTQPTKRIENLAALMSMKGVSVFADPAYANLSRAPQTIVTARANADILGLLELQHKDTAKTLTSESFKNGHAPVRVDSLSSAKTFAAYTELGASAFILNSSWCHSAKKNYATPATHTLLEASGNRNESSGNDGRASSSVADDGDALHVLLNDAESAQAIVGARDSLHARQNALALSAMTYLEQPSIIRPQLLYFDLSEDEIWTVDAQEKVVRDYSQLAEATSALMNAPWVQASQISDLLDIPASGSVRLTADAIKAHSSHLNEKALSSIDTSVTQASIPARLVTDRTSVLSPVTIAAEHLYSQNWQGDSEGYERALKDFSHLAKKYGNSVSAASVSTINLLAEQADIPVRIQNTLNVPATVSVKLDSTDARLTADKPVSIELPPASTTTVTIPVSARGSGNVQAKIRLYDAGNVPIGSPSTVNVRVRAGWENTATVIVGILVALMLIVGIIRSIKGGRRSKPVAPSDYTQARRNADLAFTDNVRKMRVSPRHEA